MKEFLIGLILSIIKALPSVFTPKSEDGQKAGALERRLKDKLKKDGWK